jgi:hypothetical protein
LLLLVGSCLNPQPDSFPQGAADNAPASQPSNPRDANGTTAVVDQPPRAPASGTPGPSANEAAPQAQAPLAPMSPAGAQPEGGDFDAGVPPPDAGEPDANLPANNAL